MDTPRKFILIAEDDKAYGNVYKAKLTSEGYDIVLVDSGDAVIPELRRRRPDLLLLDLVMPEKNGFEVLEEMRADPALCDIRVLVASNLSQDIDQEKAKKFGVADYFVKSDISITEMVEKIKKVLL